MALDLQSMSPSTAFDTWIFNAGVLLPTPSAEVDALELLLSIILTSGSIKVMKLSSSITAAMFWVCTEFEACG